MEDPKVIYLGPACQKEGDGREWCEDDVWTQCECGCSSVRYVLESDAQSELAIWKTKACESAEREAALREELATVNKQLTYKNAALVSKASALAESEQRLTAAEQRNADQLKLIAGLVEYADNLLTDLNNAWSYAGSTGNPETHKDDDYAAAVALISKPTESGASE